MNIIIRVDASIHIGSGHVMRCLVLANSLRDQGHEVSFASRPQQGDLIEFVRGKGFVVTELVTPTHWSKPQNSSDYAGWLQVTWQEDAESFIQEAPDVDLIIIDHYGINADWELLASNRLACKVFAIDDLLRKHHADMILDQTLLRKPASYTEVNANVVALTGCDFALLNPQFSARRLKAMKKSSPSLQVKILVSMGGIDQPNATLKTLKALSELIVNKPFITVLLSPNAPHYESVKQFCEKNTCWIRHITFVDDMAKLMLSHDVAIGAPGTTSWERACLGLPSIIVPLAENQKTISAQLVQASAAIKVSINEISTNLLTAYQTMMDNWHNMRLANFSICDGLGIFRVTQCINQLASNTLNTVILRPATQSNIKQVYDWQLLPETRKYALTQDIPTWDGHQKWMKAKLVVVSDFFYMIQSPMHKHNVGVLRLDKQVNGCYVVSIFIDPGYFGRGYAKTALKFVDLLHPNITIQATVLAENTASQHLFTAANYTQTAPDTFIRSPLDRERI